MAEPLSIGDIGLLDLGLMAPGQTPGDAVGEIVASVQLADEAGFERYWLAEHYARDCAFASPIPLLGMLIARSRRIQIGAGGVLLALHCPLSVASDACLLASMAPGRVEIGVGRGFADPPWDDCFGACSQAQYRERVAALADHLGMADEARKIVDGREPALVAGQGEAVAGPCAPESAKPSGQPPALPVHGPRPATWLLGSSTVSAAMARTSGLALALSLFHGEALPPVPEGVAVDLLAVAGTCASDDATARAALAGVALPFYPRVVGDGQHCASELARLREHYGARGVLFTELATDPGYRRGSIEALASAVDPSAGCHAQRGGRAGPVAVGRRGPYGSVASSGNAD